MAQYSGLQMLQFGSQSTEALNKAGSEEAMARLHIRLAGSETNPDVKRYHARAFLGYSMKGNRTAETAPTTVKEKTTAPKRRLKG